MMELCLFEEKNVFSPIFNPHSVFETQQKDPKLWPTMVTWILKFHGNAFEGPAGLQDLPSNQAKVKARLKSVFIRISSIRDQELVGLEKKLFLQQA